MNTTIYEKYLNIKRSVNSNYDILFCLNDLCDILNIKNPRDCKNRINNDNLFKIKSSTNGGDQLILYCNYYGVYELISKSSKTSGELKEKILSWVSSEVNIQTKFLFERKEISFKQLLQTQLNILEVKVEFQKQVANYKIDFYLPEYKLAIEYDENHHNNCTNKLLDKKREDIIKNKLKCEFIRLNYKLTDAENVALVLKQIFNGKQIRNF